MDLGSESVEENDVSHDGNENGSKDQSSYGNEKFGLGFVGNSDDSNFEPDQKETVFGARSEHARDSKGTPTKGTGLKRWKRIKRNVTKDPNPCVDSSKILKRGLSGNANLSDNQPFLRDVKEKNDGPSSNMFGNVEFSDGNAICGSSPDSRHAVGSGFVAWTDSENSEDRSSKSSTAASEPKFRSEKSRGRNVSSKNLANSSQRVQQGKGRIESSKKPGEGGRVAMEKENSLSSLESDSRSSNIKKGLFTVTSNGKQSVSSNFYNGGNSGEVHTNEHFTEGVQASYSNKSIGEEDDLPRGNLATNLSWGATEEKSENNQSSNPEHPLIESISCLQAVQEAFEEEIQKFREIRIEVVSPDDDSAKCSSATDGTAAVDVGLKSCLSGQPGAEEIKQTASCSLELQVLSLTEIVNILKSKLEESQGMLALKDSRISELETALSSGKPPKEGTASTIGLSEEKCEEVESELEGLFMQKIEAEVEYLAITKVMQNLKGQADFQLTLLEAQEKLSENQTQFVNKLVEAEGKVSALQNKAEELKCTGDSLVVEESFVLQKRVCKLSLNSGVVVPT